VILFQERDVVLAALLYGAYVAWVALVVACVLRIRDGAADEGRERLPSGVATPAVA
jgi:hypothetical protein